MSLTSLSTTETLESLNSALEPLEILQSDQAELGTWIHDSFSALEKLHEELTQWQSELARKETDLDLRQDALVKNQDALGKTKTTDNSQQKQVLLLEQQLAAAKDKLQQLEGENSEQLQEFERLEDRYGELEVEHKLAQLRVTELEAALAAERQRTASESELWKEEFREMRGELEKYYQMLAEKLDKVAVSVDYGGTESHTPLSAGAAHAKSAELRRRAQSRREAKEFKDPSADNLE